MLSLDNLQVSNRLGPLTCQLPSNQHIGLIGPNGSGKSTLLLSIAGLLNHSGRIQFQEQIVSEWTVSEAAIKRSMLPQKLIQLLPIACHEVIALGAAPLSVNQALIAKSINEISERLELTDFYQRDFSALSGGEQQRVLLAKTLLQVWPSLNPNGRFILLDEPLTGLDLYHQLQLLDLLNELKNKGLTVMTSLHDFNMAANHCDSIICLEHGKIVFSANVSQFNEELIEKVFHIKTHRTEIHGQIQFIPWKTNTTKRTTKS